MWCCAEAKEVETWSSVAFHFYLLSCLLFILYHSLMLTHILGKSKDPQKHETPEMWQFWRKVTYSQSKL